MSETQQQPDPPGFELLGPDEFVWETKNAFYTGTYIQNDEGDPIMHGQGEYRIGPETFRGEFENGEFL